MKRFALTITGWILYTSALYAQVTDFDHISFTKADSIAALYPGHSLRDIKSLADKLTLPLSTSVEKFRAIYSWVCNNIENDYLLFTKNKRKRAKIKEPEALQSWNKEFSKQVFKVLIERHKTVCTGYAYLIRELAYHAGITAIIIDGYGRTAQANIGGNGIANHSWNAVLLNDKWYLCDATWSSGAIDLQNKTFIKKFNSSYFLADPALFIRNHYPLDTTQAFLDQKPTLYKFLNGPLTYTGIYDYTVTSISPDSFIVTAGRNQPIDFNFIKNDKNVKKIELLLVRSGNPQIITLISSQDPATKVAFSHAFSSKGKHTAHVLFNENYICSFSVFVK